MFGYGIGTDPPGVGVLFVSGNVIERQRTLYNLTLPE
jgi:hypothetical protein